mmetsp:Transcript_48031/g.123967  ORF Transcript_48031/g.123967 Transcript_48031/m.123967 type:complete len:319 (+) Transcript_48031:582-1538(+)
MAPCGVAGSALSSHAPKEASSEHSSASSHTSDDLDELPLPLNRRPRPGSCQLASFRRSSISSCFAASIISFIAFTRLFTASSLSAGAAPTTSTPVSASVASKESRSLEIWYLMNSCMSSCVSLLSLVRLSSARLSTRSSCGLIWITRIPKRVLSSCIERKALAKFRCCSDSDSMASLNSFGVGIVDKSRGMLSSSLFCTMAAYLGSNACAEAMRPTSTSIELNCRARDTSDSFAPDWPEKRWESQAWRCRSPLKWTFVEAPSENCIGCSEFPWAARVTMGAAMFDSPPPPIGVCSMLTVPSGLWRGDRRTEKQNGLGA